MVARSRSVDAVKLLTSTGWLVTANGEVLFKSVCVHSTYLNVIPVYIAIGSCAVRSLHTEPQYVELISVILLINLVDVRTLYRSASQLCAVLVQETPLLEDAILPLRRGA